MDKSTKKTLIIAGASVGAVIVAVVVYWLWITFRGRKKTSTTMNQNQTNNVNQAVSAGKTAAGLVNYCRAQLGRPYWWGTSGQIASADLYQAKKQQWPRYYTASDFKSQFGQKVHDCAGLIEGYFWSPTPDAPAVINSNGFKDTTANGILSNATEKGLIGTMPEIPGLSVHFPGHVGVYVGNGQVIEARGHAYGVVMTPLKSRPWVSWAKIPGLKY